MRNTLRAVVTSALLLAAASTSHAQPAPGAALPERFASEATALVTPDAAAAGPWWLTFEDSALAALVQRALDANPDLRRALARVEAARAIGRATSRERLPDIGATASAARARLSDAEGGTGGTRYGSTYQAGFDASWEADVFGRLRHRTRAAAADAEASLADAASVRLTVAAEIARQYFEWDDARERHRRLEDIRRVQAGTLDIVRARFEEGAATDLDLRRARAELNGLDAQVAQAAEDVRILELRLAVLAGAVPGTLQLPDAPSSAPGSLKAIAIGTPEGLLHARPDVRAAERRLAAATARIAETRAQLFPRITLSGSMGLLTGRAGDLVDGGSARWLALPFIQIPIDLGRTRALVAARRAEAEGLEAEYLGIVLRALEDVETALSRYAGVQARIAALGRQVEDARAAADLARFRYEEGASDLLPVLDAQRVLRAAEIALVRAVTDQRTAVVAVFKAIGG